MTNSEIVAVWFAERIATGPIARNGEAQAQLEAGRADLVARLDAAKGSAADAVEAWFVEKIAVSGSAIARDTEAFNQAFRAKGDLVERLAAAAADAPAPAAQGGKAAKSAAAPATQPERAAA